MVKFVITLNIMKLIAPLTLLTLLSLPVAGYAAPALQAYASASKTEKLVICVPFLIKKSSVMDLTARRMAAKGDSAALRELRDMVFNLEYRGETLNALAQPSNKALLDQAWLMSADRANRNAYDRLVEQCVDLYNDEWHAGRIPKDLEAKKAAKITAAQAGWPDTKRPAIPADCQGRGNRDFDVCTEAEFYASAVAEELPRKVSEDLTIVTATASHRKVTITGILGYDRAKFDELTGKDPEVVEKVNASVAAKARTTICANPRAKSFISNGGQVDYLYQFNDRSTYLKPEVRYCP